MCLEPWIATTVGRAAVQRDAVVGDSTRSGGTCMRHLVPADFASELIVYTTAFLGIYMYYYTATSQV